METLVVNRLPDPGFWRGKRVLLTGHTGFKGAWMALWLKAMGAEVTGLALAPETTPALFDLADIAGDLAHEIVDLRDGAAVQRLVSAARPEIVLHLAAQALVRRSYREPAATFAINVMGTAHLLDALSGIEGLQAILVVTSDKVYANDETSRAFREGDVLGGHDPYSASKAAVEHLVTAYRNARFGPGRARLATARGGNVIGGGDYSEDRIVPDIVRAAEAGTPLVLRQPNSTRPWQHVLDCLAGYLVFAEILATDAKAPQCLNVGPDPGQPITVAEIAEVLLPALGVAQPWQLDPAAGEQPTEMKTLSLDPSRARALGIADRLPGRSALDASAEWYAAVRTDRSAAREFTLQQIAAYTARSVSKA